MNKVLNMTYASSLTNLCEVNSSFDSGILRICYTGDNRNGSHLSKSAIEKSLKTIYNCPIVCNYNRETDSFGGHDVEVVCDDDGTPRLVNLTQPVGVIPESSHIWFENYEEEDGTVHEYLYAEILLWKRQEAYRKIKEDGIVKHSMEITVKEGKSDGRIYYVDNFEFTAFTLIGVEPCFEGSALTTFSKQDFKQQMSEMMRDLKENFTTISASEEVDDKHLQNSMEGGKGILDEKKELAAKYGIDIESLDFSVEDLTIEELTEKFEVMKANADAPVKPDAAEDPQDKFALTENIKEEIYRALEEVKIEHEWGTSCRYIYADCDFEAKEVYCWDASDWLLYGFPYTTNGDKIAVNFEDKKRKKYIIADFDEGEQTSPFAPVFEQMKKSLSDKAEFEVKYQEASDKITSMETELTELRQFKADTENVIAKNDREKIFGEFTDLNGIEAFEALKTDCMKYDIDTLEEKCYAIRGRNGVPANFALENRAPIIKVDKNDNVVNEPYGGLFVEYGIGKED